LSEDGGKQKDGEKRDERLEEEKAIDLSIPHEKPKPKPKPRPDPGQPETRRRPDDDDD
jgi:hypothetical protein